MLSAFAGWSTLSTARSLSRSKGFSSNGELPTQPCSSRAATSTLVSTTGTWCGVGSSAPVHTLQERELFKGSRPKPTWLGYDETEDVVESLALAANSVASVSFAVPVARCQASQECLAHPEGVDIRAGRPPAELRVKVWKWPPCSVLCHALVVVWQQQALGKKH